jgi:branched-subunit amino acid aminotransferase/4-amino-4-deoxychorismate lyase
MRVHRGKVFRLGDHLARLNASARELGLPVEVRAEQITEILPDLLSSNDLDTALNPELDARLRLTVTPGDPQLATLLRTESGAAEADASPAPVTFLLTASEFKAYPRELYEKGMSAVISTHRANPLSPLAGHKTTSYFERLAALRQAHQARAGEAFWFTMHNETLTEGCISNVFIVDKLGLLATPPLRIGMDVLGVKPGGAMDGAQAGTDSVALCLPGVMRKVVLAAALEANILPHERLITIDDLLSAREVFITNAIMGVMPVVRVERHLVGDEKPGALTRQLAAAWVARLATECA